MVNGKGRVKQDGVGPGKDSNLLRKGGSASTSRRGRTPPRQERPLQGNPDLKQPLDVPAGDGGRVQRGPDPGEVGGLPILAQKPALPWKKVLTPLDQIAEDIGGKDRFMENCRLIPQADVNVMLIRWDHMTALERQETNLTKFCLDSGVVPVKLVGLMASTLYAYNMNVSKILMAHHQPEVVMAGIAMASFPSKDGTKDREMQFKMGGLLQDSPLVNLNINQSRGGLESQEGFMRDILNVQPINDSEETEGGGEVEENPAYPAPSQEESGKN
jgi:hypothetical protein